MYLNGGRSREGLGAGVMRLDSYFGEVVCRMGCDRQTKV